jgi:hypothetical protein
MRSQELARMRLEHIGFVFQAYNLLPVLTALENAEFPLLLRGVGKEERERRVKELFERTGLSGLEDRRPGKLSGGQQQRVAVIRAVVGEPALVLADEPTANLDSAASEALLDAMEELNRERHTTFVFATHDPRGSLDDGRGRRGARGRGTGGHPPSHSAGAPRRSRRRPALGLGRKTFDLAFRSPRVEQAPQEDELPEVVGVVVGHEERFPEERLSGPVGKRRQKIARRVGHERLHRFQIGAKGVEAPLPRALVGRRRHLRPVPFGELR